MASDVTWGRKQVRRTPKKWQLIKGHSTTIHGHFFADHMVIFHKTEIQTVILRCLMSLNLNWYKSYDTKRKNSKNTNLCFWTKLQKNGNGNISFLCHNLWTNQNLLEFRPVKHVIMTVWTSVLWKMNIHISKKWPELVVTQSFIKGHSFPISLYIALGFSVKS